MTTCGECGHYTAADATSTPAPQPTHENGDGDSSETSPAAGPWQEGEPPKDGKKRLYYDGTSIGIMSWLEWSGEWADDEGFNLPKGNIQQWAELHRPGGAT